MKYAHEHGGAPATDVWIALLLLIPASEVALAFVQRVVAMLIPPRRLMRLEFPAGLPANARTMVIVPVLFTAVSEVEELIERLEIMAIGNMDPCIHFALLSDVVDATSQELPGDAAIIEAARSGIDALNDRLGGPERNRFFLFHRERRWNAGDRVWMGWERKRGKIEEFNRLLRGATTTSFIVQAGALDLLPSIKYCITLDSDTRLPRDTAKKLVGIAAHRLNRAEIDPASGRVTCGYGILQPRVSVAMSSAAGSPFARIYAGHTGVDPYTTAVSDLYQDLFGEGVFTGKGLYDVDAFMQALEDRVPENAVLSHDLFEGLYARTALVSDIEVVDDYPSSVLAHARRQHRWVRGDWQILLWLFPFVPTRGGRARNSLPLVSRWKILDNLRRSLLPPATILLLLLGWLRLPGNPVVWTYAILGGLTFSASFSFIEAIAGPRPWQPWQVMVRNLVEDATTALARACLQVVFLAYQAGQMLHAIAITLVRLAMTRRKMLEWQTAATETRWFASAARHSGLRSFAEQMTASPIVAVASLVLIVVKRPHVLPAALPVLLAWAAAPLVAYALSQPATAHSPELSAADRRFFRTVARKTWRYFDTFMSADDHSLPPDNCQDVPHPVVAHRTSPTNIGLGLLSTLAAHDLGFIAIDELAEKMDGILSTIEGLARFEGHLFNWYDSRTLAPLGPRYVSSVDSGNLAGALLTIAAGLRQLPNEAASSTTSTSGVIEVMTLLVGAMGPAARRDYAVLHAAVSEIRTALTGPADESGRRVWLTDGLVHLDAAIAALGIGPAPTIESDVAYWARRLRVDLDAAIHPPTASREVLDSLARRAMVLADGMNFRLFYDEPRGLLSVGYRPADSEGPGRLDTSYYDLLASEARLASFIAIAKGDVPETHWFRLGRPITSIHGVPTLLSWSATLFEYLMPLLVMRSYPETLLDETCRMAVQRQIEYGRERSVPWGISECAYNLVDRHGVYQYRAFGVPGLGLRRGLGDDLVVAPYATALAAGIKPAAAARNLRRLSGARLDGPYGYYDAIDYTSREPDAHEHTGSTGRARSSGTVVRTTMAHHQGMMLVSIANVLLRPADGGAIPFGSADQGDGAAAPGAHPAAGAGDAATAARSDACVHAGGRRRDPAVSNRQHSVPARFVSVQRQLLHDRDQRRRRLELLPRSRRHAKPSRCHPRSGQSVPVSARRPHRRGLVANREPARRRAAGLSGDAGARAHDVPSRARRSRNPARDRRVH